MKTASLNIILVCILLCLAPLKTLSQDTGRVVVSASEKISRLVEKHKEISKLHPETDGFRVQIYFDSGHNSKSKAFEVYKNFIAKYPETDAYITFQEPNYKVRVGDFRTRMEAEGFLQQVLADFPSAFVIKGKILFPNLNPTNPSYEKN